MYIADEYNAAVSTLEGMLPDVTVSILKLSLALRQYSPRVLMFNTVNFTFYLQFYYFYK